MKYMSEAVGLCGVTDSPSCAKNAMTRHSGPAAPGTALVTRDMHMKSAMIN
jgi:hypothetical protein